MKRNLLLIPSVILLTLFASQAVIAKGFEPNYGKDIVVDGDFSDWDLGADFFAEMYADGQSDHGSPVLSSLFLRYTCQGNMLYALVLDETGDGLLVDETAFDAFLKVYGVGFPAETLVNGMGKGGTKVHDFRWVRQSGVPLGPVIGYEACAFLGEGSYGKVEACVSIDGSLSSTGTLSNGNTIPLTIQCTPGQPGPTGNGGKPAGRALQQNHPNPFNPVTTIRFSLEQAGPARLTVVDLLGRQVAVLADGQLAAGEHAFSFNGADLASGVYLYRLETPAQTLTRRMILTK